MDPTCLRTSESLEVIENLGMATWTSFSRSSWRLSSSPFLVSLATTASALTPRFGSSTSREKPSSYGSATMLASRSVLGAARDPKRLTVSVSTLNDIDLTHHKFNALAFYHYKSLAFNYYKSPPCNYKALAFYYYNVVAFNYNAAFNYCNALAFNYYNALAFSY